MRKEPKASMTFARTLCHALSAVLLSQALTISYGFLDVRALCLMSFSFLLCAAGVAWRPTFSISAQKFEKLLLALLQIAVCVQVGQILVAPPIYLHAPVARETLTVLHCGVVLALIFSLLAWLPRGWLPRPRLQSALFPLTLLTNLALGVWVIWHCPHPGIDVFTIQRDSARALLHGLNPYTLTFPDPYASKSTYYAPGLSVGGRLMTGYVYPPLSVLLAVPAQIMGDVRYANLAAVTGAGALLGYARAHRISFLAATLFLFLPQIFFVLVNCWTDAFVAFFLCAVLFAACRAPRKLSVFVGLLMAVKQYLFLSAPLLYLLVPESPTRRARSSFGKMLVQAFLAALFVSLPLVLWNPADYWKYAVMLNFKQPFRPDSLNFAALWNAYASHAPSSLIGFALLIPAYLLIRRHSPRTPAGFAGAFALFYFVFFLFGRQAFINYYFVIYAALCGAVAVLNIEREGETANRVLDFRVLENGESAPLHVDLATMHNK